MCATWDVVPTLCDMTGIPGPQNIDGITFLPTLMHSGEQQKHPFLYWEFPGYNGQQAVRLGKWKGIRFNMQKGNLKMKLFDLENDIREQHDVADEHPEIVKKMEDIMKKEHTTAAVDRFKMKVIDGD
jgi:arylsulfatase